MHVPDTPVQLVAPGNVAPAVLGLGFGVRFRLADGAETQMRYTVTHPPMPPQGTTRQQWNSVVGGGDVDTAFFQFDIPEELQPGDWQFSVEADGEALFTMAFTIRPAAELPALAALCRGGALLSLSRAGRAATG